jgi:hypothetical protein
MHVKPFIRITRRPYEEPYHIHLFVTASNGRQRGEMEIYDNAQSLRRFGSSLRGFPKQRGDDVLWELGSERPEDRFAFYYRLRVFQVALNGRCAIEVRFCNNEQPPDRELTEFSIHDVMPADLDRLADLLERFGKLEHRVLQWDITDGELLDD